MKKTKAQLEQMIFEMKNEFYEVENSRDAAKSESKRYKEFFEKSQKDHAALMEENTRIKRKMDFLVGSARAALNILNTVNKDDNVAVILQRNIGEAAGHLQAARNVINCEDKKFITGMDFARDDKLDAMAYIFKGPR